MNLGKTVLTGSFRVSVFFRFGVFGSGNLFGFYLDELNLACYFPVPTVTLRAFGFLPTIYLGTGWC